MSGDIEVYESSGNVFADLGFPDAEERLAKAQMTRAIRKVIRERDLTESRAAELLGVEPADVSDLTRGRLSRFSMEQLEHYLQVLNRSDG